jgi:hypothetical protein
MYISPSQIETSRGCLRLYAWEQVCGFRSPPTPATDRGTKVHGILESYLRGEGPIDATTEHGEIAQSGVRFLPEPGQGEVESEFHIPFTLSGISEPLEFFGKIDYLDPGIVIDHKTTSDFKYIKSEEVLRNDPQVILYSKAGCLKYDRPSIPVRYVYYRTAKGKKQARRSPAEKDLVISPEDLEKKVEALVEESRPLVTLRLAKVDPLSLPPTLERCGKYGGCHCRAKCTDLNSLDLLKVTLNMSNETAPISKDSLLARLRAEATGAPAPAETPAVTAAVVQAPKQEVIQTTIMHPPTVTETESPTAKLRRELAEAEAAEKAAEAEAARIEAARVEAEVRAKLAPVEPAKTEEKRGPGRPPGAKNKAKGSKAPTQTEMPISTLYVNCLPVGEEIMSASEIFATVRETIKTATGIDHYKLIEYGKGVGAWSEAVRQYCEKDLRGQDLFLSLGSPEAQDALSALEQVSYQVVRGL